jgi:hypothetical protein
MVSLAMCFFVCTSIIVAVTKGPVREEQLLHDLCLLGTLKVEIAQILTRVGYRLKYVWTPLKTEPGLVMLWISAQVFYILCFQMCVNRFLLFFYFLFFLHFL